MFSWIQLPLHYFPSCSRFLEKVILGFAAHWNLEKQEEKTLLHKMIWTVHLLLRDRSYRTLFYSNHEASCRIMSLKLNREYSLKNEQEHVVYGIISIASFFPCTIPYYAIPTRRNQIRLLPFYKFLKKWWQGVKGQWQQMGYQKIGESRETFDHFIPELLMICCHLMHDPGQLMELCFLISQASLLQKSSNNRGFEIRLCGPRSLDKKFWKFSR